MQTGAVDRVFAFRGPDPGPNLRAAIVVRLAEFAAVAACRASWPALRGLTRGRRRVSEARQIAFHLAHGAGALRLMEISRLSGRDRTTVAHACRQVGARRPQAGLDLRLVLLEQALAHSAQTLHGIAISWE